MRKRDDLRTGEKTRSFIGNIDNQIDLRQGIGTITRCLQVTLS